MKALEFTAAQATKNEDEGQRAGRQRKREWKKRRTRRSPASALLPPPPATPTLGYQRTDHSHFRPPPETHRLIISTFLSHLMPTTELIFQHHIARGTQRCTQSRSQLRHLRLPDVPDAVGTNPGNTLVPEPLLHAVRLVRQLVVRALATDGVSVSST